MNTDQGKSDNEPVQGSSATGLKHGNLTKKIFGVFYAVYNALGHGFLESVNTNALAIELREAGLEVEPELPIDVWYRGTDVGQFRADLVVDRKVLLERKAVSSIDKTYAAQLYNYLRATQLEGDCC